MGTGEVALVGCDNYERGVVESRVERGSQTCSEGRER